MPKKIAVLGCGWLGLPLAKSFVKKGYQVNGATTSVDKILSIAQHNINPFLIAVHQNHIEGNISYFLQDVDVLVINIPPRIRSNSNTNYLGKIETLSKKIAESDIKKVIFASSSSVYSNIPEIVDENTEPNPETESGKQVLASEEVLKANNSFETTIIRFGGLYGNNRHPVNSLSGKKNLSNPNSPVNLIHLEDCVSIINTIIEKEAWGKTFNAAAPSHPSKQSYYTNLAEKLGIEPPEYDENNSEKGKTITSKNLDAYLSYTFIHPELDY
ncbi:SDR family oxidoreductase [Galbibacter mesophilus]|uniref:SDR family oxidoreductase n=1 Tax=Galbibacter mesophilus TaxID=379069 RepID=UPI00191D59E2|nr:SDR family oxidoreductase [Galbibacter mesophilus]MCM5661996.1 SDR family oxidoreductase [Galbibacter mesophilus]